MHSHSVHKCNYGQGLVQQVGNDQEARKRRACRDADEDSVLSEEEDDRLAGLLRIGEDDSDDDHGMDEHAKQQLKHAHALKGTMASSARKYPG